MIIINKFVFTNDQISKIEDHYNAKYIFDSCIKTKSGWANFPAAIFYTDVPHPEGSNYFAMYRAMDNSLRITDGISAVAEPFTGIEADNGDIIYSTYRHDFRFSPDGSVSVDGGRDYLKWSGDVSKPRIRTLKVSKDTIILENDNEALLG